MKTILIPTDFSVAAENGGYYALHLAKSLEADLTLCHSFIVPTEGDIQTRGWPPYDYATMKGSIVKQLKLFANKLKEQLKEDPDMKSEPRPEIHCESELGTVSELIHHLVKETKQTMIVMGMTGMGALTRFFLGSISQQLINHAKIPVLLIPSESKFGRIKRIAFATDFSDEDIEVIRSLTGLAGRHDADLVITHVKDEWENEEQNLKKEHSFLDKLITGIDYPKFYMRHITSLDIDQGLEVLSLAYQIDMVVMVHKKTSFLHRIFAGSHSQSLARHIKIPLMVIPENLHPIF